MKNLILTLIITLPLTLWGQGWEQTFDNYERGWLENTDDGNIILTGTISNKIFVTKIDQNGEEVWGNIFFDNDSLYYSGKNIIQSDDGFLICGSKLINESYDEVFLMKLDLNGDLLWTQTFGNDFSQDHGIKIRKTYDNGYIILNDKNTLTNIDLGIQSNYFSELIKVDEFGNEIWSQEYENRRFYDIYIDNSNEILLSNKYGGNLGVVKTDEFGNEIWSQNFNDNIFSIKSIDKTIDDGYIFSCFGGNEPILVKTNQNGVVEWSSTVSHDFFNYENYIGTIPMELKTTNDGGYIITGVVGTSSEIIDNLILIKTDQYGVTQWSKNYGGETFEWGLSVVQTNDNKFISSGYIYNVDGVESLYLIKTNEFGDINWTQNFDFSSCDSVQSVINETYFLESGTYIDTLTNVFGGDSVIVQEIEILISPEYIVIEGSTDVFSSTLESYQITFNPNNSIEWNVEGETISESDGNTIQVLWGNEGIGYVKVTETDTNGCSTTSTLEVTISNESTNINDYNKNRKLIKTINLLGQEIIPKTNQPFIEIYDDGTRNRKIIIE